jgi:hypothetical protein
MEVNDQIILIPVRATDTQDKGGVGLTVDPDQMAERQLVSISRIESRSPIPMASLIRHTD